MPPQSNLIELTNSEEVKFEVFSLEGELLTELEDGRRFILTPGMSYQVADQAEAHQSSTVTGARLFLVD